ncbi:hypothetical protein GGR55DRAFT_127559 [Xylaria sp. FL0064]|nr:hypothetical protein GGR55DRAFT_127559 [Xylaria sp. FL0064]
MAGTLPRYILDLPTAYFTCPQASRYAVRKWLPLMYIPTQIPPRAYHELVHSPTSSLKPPHDSFKPLLALPFPVYTYNTYTRPTCLPPVSLLHPTANCFDCLFLCPLSVLCSALSPASDRIPSRQTAAPRHNLRNGLALPALCPRSWLGDPDQPPLSHTYTATHIHTLSLLVSVCLCLRLRLRLRPRRLVFTGVFRTASQCLLLFLLLAHNRSSPPYPTAIEPLGSPSQAHRRPTACLGSRLHFVAIDRNDSSAVCGPRSTLYTRTLYGNTSLHFSGTE